MADIELVIKISEEDYLGIKDPDRLPAYWANIRAKEAIRNGTPLPKGHGRLIDANRILNCNCKNSFSECDTCLDSELCALLNEVPTIIEADSESKRYAELAKSFSQGVRAGFAESEGKD